MARAAANDQQFLELHRGKRRVSIAVPRDLQAKLGTRLKRPLGIDSLGIANGVKWQVVAELRAQIGQARGRTVGKADPLVREALELARLRQRAQNRDELDALDDAVSARIDGMLGVPIDEDEGEPVYDMPGPRGRSCMLTSHKAELPRSPSITTSSLPKQETRPAPKGMIGAP